MKYPKKADIEKGLKALTEFLVTTCKATPADQFGTERPSYDIFTVCGQMRVTPFFDPKHTPWIACRFDNVDAAVKHFNVPKEFQWGHQLNHHSGKWNFQGDTEPQALVEHFINKATPLLTCETTAKWLWMMAWCKKKGVSPTLGWSPAEKAWERISGGGQ